MAQHLRLTALPRQLQRECGQTRPYRSLYAAALEGRFPAEQAVNGHWVYDPADLAVIAAALGLSSTSRPAA